MVSHNKVDIDKIKADAQYFDDMLSFIQPQFYFPSNKDPAASSKFAKDHKQVAARHSEAINTKRMKLDPSQYKSVVDVQKEKLQKRLDGIEDDDSSDEEEQDEEEEQEDSGNESDFVGSDDDGEGEGEEASDDDEEEEGDEESSSDDEVKRKDEKNKEQKMKKKTQDPYANISGDGSAAPLLTGQKKSLEDLQQKIKERIENMRQKRKAGEDVDDRPRKQKKLEEAEEKKQKRKDMKKKKREQLLDDKLAVKEAFGGGSGKGSQKQPEIEVEKPIDEAAIQFGTFDFTGGKATPTFLLDRQKRKNNLSALLQKAESQKKLLNELKGTDEGEEKIKEIKYDKMTKKLMGEKIKDNPLLLKKALKKKQKSKQKSTKEWKSRDADIKKKQEDRQKKRQENIDKRKKGIKNDKKKDNKGGKKFKKGGDKKGGDKDKKKRPGFEGKKKNFLNKKK